MLVQVVDKLDRTIFHCATDGNEIGHRQVLDQLAQANATRVRVHAHTKLRGHEQNRQILVHAAHSGGINLNEVHRSSLQQLLEDHPVLSVLPRRHRHRRNTAPDSCMPQHIVRARGLFNPRNVESNQLPQPGNSRIYVPALIGIDRQCN